MPACGSHSASTRTCKMTTAPALASLRKGILRAKPIDLFARAVFQDLARLALERRADLVEGREAHALHLAGFEQREIDLGDAHDLRQLLGAHLAARQHHVEIDDDRHQTNPAFSSATRRASAITRAMTSTAPATNRRAASSVPKLSEISRWPGPCQ